MAMTATDRWRRKPTLRPPEDRRASAVWEYCPLTERQCHVLQLLAEGLSFQQVAEELHISRSTAIAHSQKIRAHLSLGTGVSQTLLVAIAMREGWIQ